MDERTYAWTAYITYTESDGYAWCEEFDVVAPTHDKALAIAKQTMREAYEPGGKLSLVQGHQLLKKGLWYVEA